MSEFDPRKRRLTLKIVYYGPALSGKTTNLMSLYQGLLPEGRGDLMMLNTQGDRTIFFDLLPVLFDIGGGLKLKLKLFTVPGQVIHDATRKAVLSRADGVAFIADSQQNQSTNNFESFVNLEKNAYRVGLDFEAMPLVIQFNKRDLDNILTEEEIRERWNATGLPVYLASALYNEGVEETFLGLLRLVLQAADEQFGLAEQYAFDEESVINNILGYFGKSGNVG